VNHFFFFSAHAIKMTATMPGHTHLSFRMLHGAMRLLPAALALALVAAACGEAASTARAPTAPTASPPPTPDGVVTVAAVGDVMLARDVTTLREQHGASYPFERVTGLLRDADLTIGNKEGAFTERGTEADKLYTFRTPPRFADGLAQAGIDIVSLGNNHIADFGPEGIADTLAALDAAGVQHAGAGMDEASARAPVLLKIDGVRIAFLSYSDVAENTYATAQAPGAALATVENLRRDVQAARTQSDAVIVALHSGVEYTDAPQPQQQRLARAAVDAGARLVLGHHPHALQGWEYYGEGLIVYSLGNFVFDLDADDLAQLGERAFQTVVLS
jgi:poly-gamma-glutamate synthesis protein (capsule biosynthesis protein)